MHQPSAWRRLAVRWCLGCSSDISGPRPQRLVVFAVLASLAFASAAAAVPRPSSASPHAANATAGSTAASEDEPVPGPLTRLMTDTKWSLVLYYRAEMVEDQLFVRDALASTLRTVLTLDTAGHRSPAASGFGVLLQVEDVSVVGNDELFANAGSGSFGNGVTDRPVVADPELTSLLQARVEHRSSAGSFSLGRMEISHGDQRFVGPVGWRQHHQSFDAVRYRSPEWQWGATSWELELAYLDRVHRLTGAREPISSDALELEGQTPLGALRFFSYGLDYERSGAAVSSARTLGAHWFGEQELGEAGWGLLYDVQFARQVDAADNPGDFELDFTRLELGAAFGNVAFRLGQETLEGNGAVAFQTPLATLHKFNGWADQFLATPRDGLQDRYLRIDWSHARLTASVRLHSFDAEAGSGGSYGEEVDASLTYSVAGRHPIGLKLARYSADGFGRDVDKAMLFARWSWSN